MQEVTDLLIKLCITALFNVVVSTITCYFATRKSRREKCAQEDELIKEGLQSLLRQDIIRTNDRYVEKGYAPVYVKEGLERAYKTYHKLGGNDVATGLYHEVMALRENPKEE